MLRLKYKGWRQGKKMCRYHYPIENNCAIDRDRPSSSAVHDHFTTPNL